MAPSVVSPAESLSGSGAVNLVAVWTGSNTLGTGALTDNGTVLYVGNISFTPWQVNEFHRIDGGQRKHHV